MSGRSVCVRDPDGKVLGVYDVRPDGTCVWLVRRVAGSAATSRDAIDMIRRVAAILDARTTKDTPRKSA